MAKERNQLFAIGVDIDVWKAALKVLTNVKIKFLKTDNIDLYKNTSCKELFLLEAASKPGALCNLNLTKDQNCSNCPLFINGFDCNQIDSPEFIFNTELENPSVNIDFIISQAESFIFQMQQTQSSMQLSK